MPNAKIEKILLKNFKCHRDEKIELTNMTILTGSNAAGKSSLVQAILMAVQSWNSVEDRVISTNNIYGVNLGLPICIVSEDFQEQNVEIDLCISGTHNKVLLALHDVDGDELYFDIVNYEEIVDTNASSKSTLKDIRVFFLNAERVGPRIVSPLERVQSFSVGNKGENTSYIINEIDKIQKLDKALIIPKDLKISAIDRFSANCEEWLDTIIPGTGFKCEVDKEKSIAIIKFENQGDFYLPTATGFGITYVLPIIVQALVASMIKDSLLIVENPEAHLHPYSQSMIGKFLTLVAGNGVQVLIETHSEHVIDGCRIQASKMQICENAKVIFFEKRDKESTHRDIGIQPTGELEEWPKGFFDQKQIDLRELLEMRRCKK